MESIVVGFDGTDPSLVAMDWVAQRAALQLCRIEIVTVEPTELFNRGTVDAALGEAGLRVRDVAPDAEISFRRVAGRMPDALLDSARQADLIVIGVRRGRPVRGALTGWRPLRTAARSEKPIVVVPDDWTATDGPILLGVDDDSSSSAAVDFAAAEARVWGAGLTVLHAWQMPVPTMDGTVALLASPIAERAAHRRILDGVCGRITETYPELTVERTLVQESPSSALLTETRRSSLLVIGSHRRGILAGAFFGSVGQDTLVESRIPVCVVPGLDLTG